MTRLEWRYLQRIALDHPYFDTHKLPLTEKEAKAIIEANNTMTGREFVDSIYAKLGMTRPEEKKDRFAWLHNIGELFTVPPIRKIAIAVLVVVLMTVFFAATPTGRAIAESVIQYIVTLLDHNAVVSPRDGNYSELIFIEQYDQNYTGAVSAVASNMQETDSISLFIERTGKSPFKIEADLLSVEYDDKNGIFFVSNYALQNGGIVSLLQAWDCDDELITSLHGSYQQYPNHSLYYAIDSDDTISCIYVLEDSVLYIYGDNNVDMIDIVRLFDKNLQE